MAFTTVTVTGSIREADGSPAEGQIEFMLDQELYNAGSDEIAVRKTVIVPLVSGDFSTTLYATTDPDTSPTGGTYLARVRTGLETFEFHFELSNTVTTVDIADIQRSSPTVGSLGINIFRYVGSSDSLITDPNYARPNVAGPVYWLMASGVVPANAIVGDIVFTEA